MDATAHAGPVGAEASAAPLTPFYAGLGYHVGDLAPHPGVRCAVCCHWALPFQMPAREVQAFGVPGSFAVALTYPQWLLYHWHIVHHQAGCPVLPA